MTWHLYEGAECPNCGGGVLVRREAGSAIYVGMDWACEDVSCRTTGWLDTDEEIPGPILRISGTATPEEHGACTRSIPPPE